MNGKGRRLRSKRELKKAAADVRYEFNMLLESSLVLPLLPDGVGSPADSVTSNMALESFLLHYRNLLAFLCPSLQPSRPTDVIASDYLNSPTATDVVAPKVLGFHKAKIDTMLAHLSYNRGKYAAKRKKNWPVKAMLDRVERGMSMFVKGLPPDRQKWFQ